MIPLLSTAALSLCATTTTGRLPRLPQSPQEMVQDAVAAVARGAAAGVNRQIVKVVVPDDERLYKVDTTPLAQPPRLRSLSLNSQPPLHPNAPSP